MDELISIHRSHDHGISKHIVLVYLMRVEGHQRNREKREREKRHMRKVSLSKGEVERNK